MSYDLEELSEDSGRPIELYEFSRDGKTWRYTSGDKLVSAGPNNYLAEPIVRSAIFSSQDVSKSSLRITVARTNDFAEQYILNPPATPINMLVKSYHFDDDAIADPYNLNEVDPNIITIWTGEVINVKFTGKNESIILCRPSINAMDRSTLRRLYQVQCPHPLYGDKCRANPTDSGINISIETTDGISITASDLSLQPDGYYSGGYIEFAFDGYIIRRSIIQHAGSSISVNLPAQGISSGTTIDVFPGCDKSIATCATKFSNSDNFGGFPFFPDKNPFGNDPIF